MGTKEAQQRFVRRREAAAGFSPLITASPKKSAHEKKYSRKGSKVILICSGLLVPPFSSTKKKGGRGQEKDLANNLCIIAEKKPFCAKRVFGVVVGGEFWGGQLKKEPWNSCLHSWLQERKGKVKMYALGFCVKALRVAGFRFILSSRWWQKEWLKIFQLSK